MRVILSVNALRELRELKDAYESRRQQGWFGKIGPECAQKVY